MAVRYIGALTKEGQTTGTGAGFNWLVQASLRSDESREVTTDIRDLLPEDLMHSLFAALPQSASFDSVEAAVERLADASPSRLLPGNPISIAGILRFTGVPANFDPFNPPDIEINTFHFHGERCFVGELHSTDAFRLPIYFSAESKNQVLFSNAQPVKVTGIVRWSPPYSPGGSRSLTLAIRAAALWLR